MTDNVVAFWTFVFTVIGVVIAAGGIFYAIKTLQAGAKSLRLAAQEAQKTTESTRAQFWLMLRLVFANYDDVHVNLRPTGIWAPKTQEGEMYALRGPQNAAEWGRVELYMGTFEFCETLIRIGFLDKEDFGKAYRYRPKTSLSMPSLLNRSST